MGMSASQARLLSITARLTNNEFRAQTITNSKLRLASESEEASRDYMDVLRSKQLMFMNYDENLINVMIGQYLSKTYTDWEQMKPNARFELPTRKIFGSFMLSSRFILSIKEALYSCVNCGEIVKRHKTKGKLTMTNKRNNFKNKCFIY